MKLHSGLVMFGACLAAVPALAQTAPGTFNLGQIETVTVTAQHSAPIPMSTSILSNDTVHARHAVSLNQALDMIPGAAVSNSGGSRNEQLIFVHGFDRFQTPISIDGIRVYLPADNRLDFGRFLTADLAEIQVAKGYVSVLNGPGALGGAINLVTRKPTGELDVDARSGLVLGNSGSLNGEDASFSLGTNQGSYYLQGSVAWAAQQRFELSDGYIPTATQAAGFRSHSRAHDLTLHVKAGYTPNDTDEYSISYIQENGTKDAPFAVSDPLSIQRDWTWPYWDISSIYFLSTTALGETSYAKTRLYYNTFKNGLFAYDDASFTTQTKPKAFNSYYDDYAYGGNIELGTSPFAGDTLKFAFFYRRDSHDEWQALFSPRLVEPHQVTVEDTYSIAAENSWRAADRIDLVAGISYDWRHLLQAQDYVAPSGAVPGALVHYPLADGSALNGQAALIWTATDTASYYANVSDRTRFPTLAERFSTRFGTAASNPNLQTERAANFEIGTRQDIQDWHFEGAVFYSDVSNVIEAVILPPPAPSGTTQSRNVGHGTYYGMEVSASGPVSSTLSLGANYTYQARHIRTPANVTPLQLTGNPEHKSFIYLNWAATADLVISPNLSLASNRWTSNTAGTRYFKTGAFALAGLSATYRLTGHIDLNAGVKNLFDQNYQLTDGFPETGRNYFLSLRYRQ